MVDVSVLPVTVFSMHVASFCSFRSYQLTQLHAIVLTRNVCLVDEFVRKLQQQHTRVDVYRVGNALPQIYVPADMLYVKPDVIEKFSTTVLTLHLRSLGFNGTIHTIAL
jgi:hypothetical protein